MYNFSDLMINIFLQNIDLVINILQNAHIYNIDLGTNGNQLCTELLCGRLTKEDTELVLQQLKNMHSYQYYYYMNKKSIRDSINYL